MTTPEFIVNLRRRIGHEPLWLLGCSTVVLRETHTGPQVLLGRRADNGNWTTIDGIVEPLEPPEKAAARECLEETGLRVRIDRLVMVGVTGPIRYPNGDVCSFVDHVFRAHCAPGSTDEAGTGDGENSAVGWFEPTALPEAITPVSRRRIETALADAPDVVLAGRYEQV
ncbi:ADP-ribose pyrophosphatase YjhB, NUDIX family [Propionibacterium cyclohexanicum]|uniref:ADP-ribose pyrophosphatase YjhB, NUDIX family n=1 Tax=Propionibacterium cyclohexanicum TaxID=64702 RepID=A0A1H9QGE2_9ACTN|nr:NUDIX domain-containing protein [Propionibacterium cyclohexanicum]SER59487.1 ADP-ribose pyrophosphatase YjhB, NUDIX family [Propionibacterium cyclohexanicum]